MLIQNFIKYKKQQTTNSFDTSVAVKNATGGGLITNNSAVFKSQLLYQYNLNPNTDNSGVQTNYKANFYSQNYTKEN